MKNTKYTTKEYISQISSRNIYPIEEYTGAHNKIMHHCLVCDHKWSATPGAIRNGHGCPSCYQLSVRKPLSQVVAELSQIDWEIIDTTTYVNSYKPLTFKHICGNIVTSNLDRILRKTRRCLECFPSPKRKCWSNPVTTNNRSYASNLEMQCCEYLIQKFGVDDIILQKYYSSLTKQTSDAYVKSLDTYVEISSINKLFYLERIWNKRKKVNNFIFVSSIEQLKLFF